MKRSFLLFLPVESISETIIFRNLPKLRALRYYNILYFFQWYCWVHKFHYLNCEKNKISHSTEQIRTDKRWESWHYLFCFKLSFNRMQRYEFNFIKFYQRNHQHYFMFHNCILLVIDKTRLKMQKKAEKIRTRSGIHGYTEQNEKEMCRNLPKRMLSPVKPIKKPNLVCCKSLCFRLEY